MQAGAKKYDVDLFFGNSSNSLDREIRLIDTYIVHQVDAIVLSPYSLKGSIPGLKRAHQKGIHIVTYNTTVENDLATSFIETDQRELGRTTGRAVRQYIQETLGGRAKLAMIECIGGAPEQCSTRSEGFIESVQDMPDVEIVARQDAWLSSQATDVTENILTAYPEVNVFWASNEGGTVGAVTGVRNSGRSGNVVVFGTDISEQLGNFLLAKDNILQAITGQQPFEMGFMAVEAAVKILRRESVEKEIHLPVTLFPRTQPKKVREYQDRLRKLAG